VRVPASCSVSDTSAKPPTSGFELQLLLTSDKLGAI
jgi:hypothetical protein